MLGLYIASLGTKLDHSSFSGSRDLVGAHQNLSGSRDLTMPLSEMVYHPRASTCYNQPIWQLSNLKSLTPPTTKIRKVHCSYYVPILHRLWDTVRYWWKVADLNLPHLNLVPLLGVNLLQFGGGLWCQQTRVPGLSYGVVCMILSLAFLLEHRLATDRWTDGRMMTARTVLA